MSKTKTLVIYGSATIGDIEPLSDEGSQTFLLHGKKVKLLNKSGKKVKRIDIDGRRMYQKADGLPMADISRVWVNGGVTITGQATVGDTDGTVVYGDVKREWVNGGVTITGSATVGDTDGSVVYGDTVRSNDAITDYSGYIEYSDHSLVINSTTTSTGDTNRVAVFDCQPSTTYTITMNMYSRFRVCSYAGVPTSGTVMTNYAFHSLDDNSTASQGGTSQSLTYTTGASDTKLFIGYWTTVDIVKPMVIRQSVKVEVFTLKTLCLLHFNDGITDETGNTTWTNSGGATISSTQSKFGGNSLYLNGSSYLSASNSSMFNFGTKNFTIDWWEYVGNSASLGNLVFAIQTSATDGSSYHAEMSLAWNQSGTRNVFISSSGGDWEIASIVSMGRMTYGQWVHRALVRSGNTFYTFENGVLVSTFASSSAIYYNSAYLLMIGARNNRYFNGYIDEFRISSIARWTENFTPPTEPYVVD